MTRERSGPRTASAPIGRATARWLLAGVLLLSLGLDATAIGWGLPATGSATWSYDEIPPEHLGDDAALRHGGRYPPFHYDLLRTLYAPLRLVRRAGWLTLDQKGLDTALRLVGRSLSVAMAAGIVLLLYRLARILLVSRRAALLAAVFVALPVPFVRFAKTVNLDIPYTFWFLLSLYLLLRSLTRNRWRDWLQFAIAMALAIGTKDQAAGLYLAVPLLVLAALGGELRRAGMRRPYLRAAVDPRPLVSLSLALALLAFIHRLPFGLDEFPTHLRAMLGKGIEGRADFPATLRGQAGLALASLRQIVFSLGWPAFTTALAGIGIALRERRGRLLLLLAMPLGYYLAFITPIRHVRVRWWIPAMALLALFAALAVDRWLSWRRPPRLLRAGVVAALLAYSLLLPICLDLQMLRDSRYRVEDWLAERARLGERWRAISDHSQLNVRARDPLRWGFLRRRPRWLRHSTYEYLVVNRDEARQRAPRLLADLDAGRTGYREVLRHRADPCCGLPDWSGVSTVLITVNPELSVYRKLGPPVPPRNAAAP